MSLFLSSAQSLVDAYRDTRQHPKQRLPEVIQFPVNDICNSRCEMCYIWEKKRGVELSPADVRQIFSDPLFRRVRGVGFNGGEPTLRRDLPELVDAVAASLPDLREINVITNAIQARQVLESVRGIRRVAINHQLSFSVMVSLDGVGKIHDQVRGRDGNFESAVTVLNAIRDDSLADAVLIGCTLTTTNARYGQELLEWCIERGYYARFRVAVPHGRLYNRDRTDDFLIGSDDLFHVLMLLDRLHRQYETNKGRRQFYRSLMDQLAYGEPRKAGCAWRNHGATIFHDGTLGFCAVESPSLGSSVERPASELYWNNAPVLAEIVENKCDGCQHDYDGPGDFLDEVKKRVPRRYGIGRFLRTAERVRTRVKDTSQLVQSTARIWSSFRRQVNIAPAGDLLLLTGWYGTETVGDQAILAGLLELISQSYDGPVAVASLEPFVTHRTLELLDRSSQVETLTYGGARDLVEQGAVRAVAMAGGPLMGTIQEILDLGELHAAASRRAVPTGLLGSGVGPIGKGLRRRILVDLLLGSTVVMLRDGRSADMAHKLTGRRFEVCGDPALVWLYNSTDGADRQKAEITNGESPPVGLAIRDWPLHEYGQGLVTSASRDSLEHELDLFVSSNLDRYDFQPINMGVVPIGGDDRRVQRRLLGPGVSSETRLTSYPTPDSILATVSRCQAVVAMRFHASLFSLAAGTPVVAIDYTLGGKLAALADQFPDSMILLDPRSLTATKLSNAVDKMLQRGSKPDLSRTAVATRCQLSSALNRLLGSKAS